MPAELATGRLLLRPFRDSDVAQALAYRDDREFARFLPHIPQPFTRRDAEAFVSFNMSERWERSLKLELVRAGDHAGRDGEIVDEVAYALNLAPKCGT